MDFERIRTESLKWAADFGYQINPSLPFLDPPSPRDRNEIYDRMMCMNALAACAYGFNGARAAQWLREEGVASALTMDEQVLLTGKGGNPQVHIERIEGIWALAWVLMIVGVLDFAESCHSQFVTLMPNLRVTGSSRTLRESSHMRPIEQVVRKLDLAYCLHWAVRESDLRQVPTRGAMYPYVIIERRRALEWCLYDQQWEEISLDT